jgi:hypothetical protein
MRKKFGPLPRATTGTWRRLPPQIHVIGELASSNACVGSLKYSAATVDFQAQGKGLLGDQNAPAISGFFEQGKLVSLVEAATKPM